MKKATLYLILLCFACLFATCKVALAQGGSQFIRAKCPTGISGYGSVTIQLDGNINAIPCATKNFQINGVNVSAGGTTGSGTTNYFPLWTSSTALGDSVLRFTNVSATFDGFAGSTFNLGQFTTGTQVENKLGNAFTYANYTRDGTANTSSVNTYAQNTAGSFYAQTVHSAAAASGLIENFANTGYNTFSDAFTVNNFNANAQFTVNIVPSVAAGRARIGDFTTTATTYLDINQTAGTANLFGNATNFFTASQTQALVNSSTIILNSLTGTATIGDTGGAGNGNTLTVDDTANAFTFTNTGLTATMSFIGINDFTYRRTITAGGTTGNQIINRPAGTVNLAGAAAAITVTNSTVNASSIVMAIARTDDATCSVKNVVAGAGSFVINMTAACTAETSVGFIVTN